MSENLIVEKIGWFHDMVQTHPHGLRMSVELFNKLLDIGKKYRVRCCFGHRVCKVCFQYPSDYYELPIQERKLHPDYQYWGNGELWVMGKTKLWVLPTLVVHYIRDHGYYPPQEFMRDLNDLTEEQAGYYHKFEKDNPEKFLEIYGKV
jgi:hypothetical protein